jgi:hypothetical protein
MSSPRRHPSTLHQKFENEHEHDFGRGRGFPLLLLLFFNRARPRARARPRSLKVAGEKGEEKRARLESRKAPVRMEPQPISQPAFDRYPIKIENEDEHDFEEGD